MRVPIELVRVIVKMNEDYFFLVSLKSFFLVPLKKIHAIPKATEFEEMGQVNFYKRIDIRLPIGSTRKSFVIYYYFYGSRMNIKNPEFERKAVRLDVNHSTYFFCNKCF
jgi:hypothetical protein